MIGQERKISNRDTEFPTVGTMLQYVNRWHQCSFRRSKQEGRQHDVGARFLRCQPPCHACDRSTTSNIVRIHPSHFGTGSDRSTPIMERWPEQMGDLRFRRQGDAASRAGFCADRPAHRDVRSRCDLVGGTRVGSAARALGSQLYAPNNMSKSSRLFTQQKVAGDR